MRKHSCVECDYFKTFEADPKLGECLRYPPVPFLTQVQVRTALDPTPKLATNRENYFPLVLRTTPQCGEFVPLIKDDEKQQGVVSLVP